MLLDGRNLWCKHFRLHFDTCITNDQLFYITDRFVLFESYVCIHINSFRYVRVTEWPPIGK